MDCGLTRTRHPEAAGRWPGKPRWPSFGRGPRLRVRWTPLALAALLTPGAAAFRPQPTYARKAMVAAAVSASAALSDGCTRIGVVSPSGGSSAHILMPTRA